MYCDDVDFSWRARLAGYRVVYQPTACVFHDKRLDPDGQIVAGEAEVYYSAEASLMMAWKWSNARPAGAITARAAALRPRSASPGGRCLRRTSSGDQLPSRLDPEGRVASSCAAITLRTGLATMTDPTQPAAFSLAALVPCGRQPVRISETLLSLAAQTSGPSRSTSSWKAGRRPSCVACRIWSEPSTRTSPDGCTSRPWTGSTRGPRSPLVWRGRGPPTSLFSIPMTWYLPTGPRRSESMPLAPAVGPWHPWSRCRPLTHGRGVTYER
jgi:hypothetical protein